MINKIIEEAITLTLDSQYNKYIENNNIQNILAQTYTKVKIKTVVVKFAKIS